MLTASRHVYDDYVPSAYISSVLRSLYLSFIHHLFMHNHNVPIYTLDTISMNTQPLVAFVGKLQQILLCRASCVISDVTRLRIFMQIRAFIKIGNLSENLFRLSDIITMQYVLYILPYFYYICVLYEFCVFLRLRIPCVHAKMAR